MNKYKIRLRERNHSSPPAGMSQGWIEYQVVEGRKIVARCGSREAAEGVIAEKLIADLEART
jgi:hypothetical protein